MIVPKVYKNNKACMLVYLNDIFDIEKLDENFDVNCAIIYNPCFEELDMVLEKLRNQGRELRILVEEKDYNCLNELKNKDFDILEVMFNGDLNIKKKLLELEKDVEIYINKTNIKKVDIMLWNLKEFKKVFVKKELEGKIKKHDNVKFI